MTEWSSLIPLPGGKLSWDENPSVDDLSGAATACDLAMAVDEDCDAFCWWEASDVFEESGMPQSEFSNTYGLLTLNGLPKATFNAFSFLNRLRGGRLEVRHEALPPGCGLVATAEGESLQVLLWHRISLSMKSERSNLGPACWKCLGLNRPSRCCCRSESRPAPAVAMRPGSPWERLKISRRPNIICWKFMPLPKRDCSSRRRKTGRVTHEFRLAPGEVLYL